MQKILAYYKFLVSKFKFSKPSLSLSKEEYKLVLLSSIAISITVIPALVLGFVLGNLWTRVYYLENAGTGSNQRALKQPADPSGQPVVPTNFTKPTKNDHIKGSSDAQLALISYSDFDCPFCSKFHETMSQTLKAYDKKIMLVYRHFPLPQLHPEAFKKAEASECAFEQGGEVKFWEFADKIYGSDLEKVADLPQIIADLGLDVAKFNDCLATDKYAQKVKDQITDGEQAGVQGTPGNFLMNLKDGKINPIRGAVPFEVLKAEIDKMLQ